MTVEQRRAATAIISDDVAMERVVTASSIASRAIADYTYAKLDEMNARTKCDSIHRFDFSPIECGRKVLDALVEAGYLVAEPAPVEGDPIFELLGDWLTQHPSERVLPIVMVSE